MHRLALTRSWLAPSAPAVAVIAALALLGPALAWVIVKRPDLYRPLLTAAVVAILVILARRSPRTAIVTWLLLVPLLALTRRLLIAPSGWSSNDPLLLIGPLLAMYLIYRAYLVQKRPFTSDRVEKLALVLLGFGVVEAFNPTGGSGIVAGLGGLIFLGVPLLWFFLGRLYATRRMVTILLVAAVPIAVAAACYGLWQTHFRTTLPPWDLDWFNITGYQALEVGSQTAAVQIRPFATFSSNAEYSAYLSFGVVIALALAMHRRVVALAAIPVLLFALFYAGGRSVMVLTMLSCVALFAIRRRRLGPGLAVFLAGLVVVYGAALVFGSALDKAAQRTGDAITARSVGGLLNPLDPSQSTFLGHWNNLRGGVQAGITSPLGKGTGAANIATDRLSGGKASGAITDNDLADVFVSFGFVGGMAYLALIVILIGRILGGYATRGDPLLLAIGGLLVANFEHWLNGGYYAVASLFWFVVGWASLPRPDPASSDPSSTPESTRAQRSAITGQANSLS